MAKKEEVKAPIVYGEFVVVKQTAKTKAKAIILTGKEGKLEVEISTVIISTGPLVPKNFGLAEGDNPIFAGTPRPSGFKMISGKKDEDHELYAIFHYQSFIGKEDK